jgi:hypothetical protein
MATQSAQKTEVSVQKSTCKRADQIMIECRLLCLCAVERPDVRSTHESDAADASA